MLSIRSPVPGDNSIGRVDVSRIPTPHTIGGLAAQICKQENRRIGFDWDTDDAYGTMLLRTTDSPRDYNLEDKVDLLGAERPGATLQEPILLKVWHEELQAVFGSSGFDRAPERSVNSHKTPVYIYYKVYNEDKKEMVSLRSPVESDNPYLGRVDTCQIPTPHTIGGLAAHICKQENRPIGFDWDHDDAHGTMLLRTADSPRAYDLGDKVDLLGAERPGATPQEPVLLKVWYEELQAVFGSSGFDRAPERSVNSHKTPVYIYYKVYNEDKKEMVSLRSPVESVNPYLGRVDTCQIPTPHTIVGLAAQICKQENRPIGFDWDNDDAYGTMLLRTADSPRAYNLEDKVDLLGAERPGATSQDPVLLKIWYEELQTVFGVPGFDRPAERTVNSHLSLARKREWYTSTPMQWRAIRVEC
ncbi:hypothetical protein B0H12DRAFT_1242402 [Mycena haematopus]|nr:hypothetical protein B0H12DRAFT_1242402 [Mycena haematopus]